MGRQDVQAKSVYALLNALGKLGLEEGFLRAYSLVSQRVDHSVAHSGGYSVGDLLSGELECLSSGVVDINGQLFNTSQWLRVDRHVDNTRRPGSFNRAVYQVTFQPPPASQQPQPQQQLSLEDDAWWNHDNEEEEDWNHYHHHDGDRNDRMERRGRRRVACSLLTEPLLSTLYKLVLLTDPSHMTLQGTYLP